MKRAWRALPGLRSGRTPPTAPPRRPDEETISLPVANAGDAAEPATGGAVRRGARLGRYLVLGAIGTGGSANVYAAYDPQLDRKVALKVLRGGGSRSRLLAEAQAAARLSHPNVVSVHDVGVVGGHLFVAMELVEGVTLDEWLLDGPRSWREVVRVLLAAGQGLAAAHAAGLVHGDFKPANVMVADDGRVLVLDFGLARRMGVRRVRRAVDPSGGGDGRLARDPFRGTPGYVAPEVAAGFAADLRADQYGFCATLHRALYGVPPGASAAVGGGRPREADRRRLPGQLRRVVARGLDAAPQRRHATLDHLLRDLSKAVAARRRLAIRIAVPAAATVALAVVLHGGAAAEVCGGGELRLAGAWDDSQRLAVRRAFARTGHRGADEAWRRTRLHLDDYAGRWSTLHREFCEATRLRREQSERVLDLQMACLDARREELATVARVLRQADGELVERSVAIAEALSSLERCANRASIQAEPAAPRDPAAAAIVARLDARLAEAKVLEAAGRYSQAADLSRAVVARARQIQHAPTEAEALLRLAMAEGRIGLFPEMRRDLVAAAAVAAAADHHRAVGMAYTFLIIAAVNAGDAAEAHAWAELSGAALGRFPDRDGLAAHRELFLGELAHLEERYADAIEHHESYLRLGTCFGATGRAYAHLHLARQHGALGALADAERHLVSARDLFLESVGAGHRAVAQTATEMGKVLAARGEHANAAAHYDEALEILERAGEADDFDSAVALEGLGGSLLALGQHERAVAVLLRARAARLSRPARPGDLGEARFLLARALWRSGDRAGARDEARAARGLLAAVDPAPEERLREVDEWLAARGGAR